MTAKNIVQAALSFETTSVTPYWLHQLAKQEGDVAAELDKHYGSRAWRDKFPEYLDGMHVGFINSEAVDGIACDTFGVKLKAGSTSRVVDTLFPTPELRNYKWPEPEGMTDWLALEKHVKQNSNTFQCWGLAMGLFERSWHMRGMENIMMDMVENEAFVHELLDGILDVQLKFMDMMTDRIPLDAYAGGDDICDQRGCMIGADRWRHFFKPRLQKLTELCHSKGLKYVMHSCGNLMPVVEDLIEIGVDVLESVQPEAMDVYELKKITHGRMALIGGMGVQHMMCLGTPDEIREETKKLIKLLGKGGGYIIAPAKPLQSEPAENVAAFIETIQNTRG